MLSQKRGDQFGGEILRSGDRAETHASAVQAFHGIERVAQIGDYACDARGGGDGFAAGVGRRRFPVRSKSGRPASSSRSLMREVRAAGVTWRAAAALTTVPLRATS